MTPNRIHNFSAGPAKIPDEVAKQVQEDFYSYQGKGYSICEISHRSELFESILNEAIQDLRDIMQIPDNYAVVFLSCGASINYAMLPMNFSPNKRAAYINTGVWSAKALNEAKKLITADVPASSEATGFDRIPELDTLSLDPDTDYVHITSNNTIYGSQYHTYPSFGHIPLVADMTSDIASRTVNVADFGVIYAGLQKNLGLAGVSVVIFRRDLCALIPENIPTLLDYGTYVRTNSMFNTPNTFGIYVAGLVTKWIKKKGGIGVIEKINAEKADRLYTLIDQSGLYQNRIQKASRSIMNVTFFLGDQALEQRFLSEAEQQGLYFLKGHKTAGGIRASIYNPTEMNAVEELAAFMTAFEKKI